MSFLHGIDSVFSYQNCKGKDFLSHLFYIILKMFNEFMTNNGLSVIKETICKHLNHAALVELCTVYYDDKDLLRMKWTQFMIEFGSRKLKCGYTGVLPNTETAMWTHIPGWHDAARKVGKTESLEDLELIKSTILLTLEIDECCKEFPIHWLAMSHEIGALKPLYFKLVAT